MIRHFLVSFSVVTSSIACFFTSSVSFFPFLGSFRTKTWSLESRSFSIFFDIVIHLWFIFFGCFVYSFFIILINITVIIYSGWWVYTNITFAVMGSSFAWRIEFFLVTVKVWKEALKLYSAILTWKSFFWSTTWKSIVFPIMSRRHFGTFWWSRLSPSSLSCIWHNFIW